MLKLAPRDRIIPVAPIYLYIMYVPTQYQLVNDKEEYMIILITSHYFFSISLEVCSRAGYRFEGRERVSRSRLNQGSQGRIDSFFVRHNGKVPELKFIRVPLYMI